MGGQTVPECFFVFDNHLLVLFGSASKGKEAR